MESVKKSVSFSPYASRITVPLDDNEVTSDSRWYDQAEMQRMARADVNFLISQEKKAITSGSRSDGNKDEATHHYAAAGVQLVCRRGLEMYMPGKLAFRQKRRRAFSYVLLQKQEVLLTLEEDKNEIAERLRRFAEIRSKKCKDEARALGEQDALDAASILKANDITNSAKITDIHRLQIKASNTTPVMTKQMLTETFDALVDTKTDTDTFAKPADNHLPTKDMTVTSAMTKQVLTETMRNTSVVRAA